MLRVGSIVNALELPRRLLDGRVASALMLGIIAFASSAMLLEQRFLFLSQPLMVLALALLGAAYGGIATVGWSLAGSLPASRATAAYALCIVGEIAVVTLMLLIVRDSGIRHSIILVPITVQIVSLPRGLRLIFGTSAVIWLIALTAYVYTLPVAVRDTTYLLANFLIVSAMTWLLLTAQETIAQAEYLFGRVRQSNLRIQASAQAEQTEADRRQALLNAASAMMTARDMRSLMTVGLAALKTAIDYQFVQVFLRHNQGYLYLAEPPAKRQGAADFLSTYDLLIDGRVPRAFDSVRVDDELARAIAIADLTLFGVQHFAQVQSWLGIPLIHGDTAIGLLVLEHDSQAFYRDIDPMLIQTFARQFAAAIDGHRDAARMSDLIVTAERRRVAALLENGLGVILMRMADEPPEGLARLARGAQAELSLQIDALRPASQGTDLAIDVTRLVNAADARSAITFSAVIDLAATVSGQQSVALVRIISSLIRSLEQHAAAGDVIITLTAQADEIRLRVRERTQPKPGHEQSDRLGIPVIQREVNAIGAQYEITPSADGWTDCAVWMMT